MDKPVLCLTGLAYRIYAFGFSSQSDMKHHLLHINAYKLIV
jgi:hypothetical protein